MFEVNDVDVIASGVRSKRGFGTDYAHVSYAEEGVNLMVSNDSELAPVDGFERFVARLLRASVDAATRGSVAATRQSWWKTATEDVNAIVARAYPAGSTSSGGVTWRRRGAGA